MQNEYYIRRIWTTCHSARPIFGKWKMVKEFINFLRNPRYLVLEIGKDNNFELDEGQVFDFDGEQWRLEYKKQEN